MKWTPLKSIKRELELISVYILTFPPKLASKLIHSLQDIEYPSHLKRIRKNQDVLEFLICGTDSISRDQVMQLMSSLDFIKNEVWEINEIQVPLDKPQNKIEYHEWREYWPVSLQIDPSQEMTLSAQQEITSESWISLVIKGSGNNAIIVDQATNIKIAESVDESHAHPLHHAIMNLIRKVSELELKRRQECPSAEPRYLCFGLDVYVRDEPCIMCCMALVHSRINRLFFVKEKPKSHGGGLFEFNIHEFKPLNHHFQVYKYSLNDE